MLRHFTLTLVFFVSALSSADRALDDFDDGKDINSLGFHWYYYSDVNDSGNSVINGATLKAGGGYTRVLCGNHDSSGENRCAVLDYRLGDTLVDFDDYCFSEPCELNAFVGIGTDLCPAGTTVDIHTVDSISFYAFSPANVQFHVEFVSEALDSDCDNGFIRGEFEAFDHWTRFVLPLADCDYPEWVWSPCLMDPDDYFKKTVKINWRVAADYSYHANMNDSSGVLMIDDVVLHGVDQVPEFNPKVFTTVEKNRLGTGSADRLKTGALYDILGRQCIHPTKAVRGAGLYILRSGTDSRSSLFVNDMPASCGLR